MRASIALFGLSMVLTHVQAGLYDQRHHLPLPKRELEWKGVNFLSISDTHGWLLGHQHATWPEPNYSGDYGDFASFATHMRAMARSRGVDLLLIDAGDHHDGSGLVSSSKDSATRTDEIFSMVEYDIMTIGNHELYRYETAKELYDHRDRWHGRYLTSNVNITVFGDEGKAVSVPIGDRYAKFETESGKKVTAFGAIFNFQAHGPNLTIQSSKRMVEEAWFKTAIEDAPDYFVVAGHMPVRGETSEFTPIFDTIRKRHPDIPVFIFGGHTHVRDCVQYDDRSIAVVSGRYMETIAFTSASLPPQDAFKGSFEVSRRYIDANRQSYKFHSNRTDDNFDTSLGMSITTHLLYLAASLNISNPLGKAPHDFFLSRYPQGHPKHVVTEFGDKVLPAVLVDERRREQKRLIIGNTGTLRFDLFQGRFDRNDELTLSPFGTTFFFAPLPAGIARNITDQMNRSGASKLRGASRSILNSGVEDEEARVDRIYRHHLAQQWDDHVQSQLSRGISQDVLSAGNMGHGHLTMGYVTKDACPGQGDDIEHVPVPYSNEQFDFFSSPFPDAEEDELLDVVVFDFALDDFLAAVNTLDPSLNLSFNKMQKYAPGLVVSEVWGKYARSAWN